MMEKPYPEYVRDLRSGENHHISEANRLLSRSFFGPAEAWKQSAEWLFSQNDVAKKYVSTYNMGMALEMFYKTILLATNKLDIFPFGGDETGKHKIHDLVKLHNDMKEDQKIYVEKRYKDLCMMFKSDFSIAKTYDFEDVLFYFSPFAGMKYPVALSKAEHHNIRKRLDILGISVPSSYEETEFWSGTGDMIDDVMFISGNNIARILRELCEILYGWSLKYSDQLEHEGELGHHLSITHPKIT